MLNAIYAALRDRLEKIPDGEVAKTAKLSRIPDRSLRRLRAGDTKLNPTLTTLVRLARGLGVKPHELIDAGKAAPEWTREEPRPTVVDVRLVDRLVKRLSDATSDVQKLAASVKAVPRPRRGTRG